jgi:hypothetical protein
MTVKTISQGENARKAFDPIVGQTANILILGSFPGEESLKKGEYYAHPYNLFWDMADALCGAGRSHDYISRCDILIGLVHEQAFPCHISGHIQGDFPCREPQKLPPRGLPGAHPI